MPKRIAHSQRRKRWLWFYSALAIYLLAANANAAASCAAMKALAQEHSNDMARRNSMDHDGFFERRVPRGARARMSWLASRLNAKPWPRGGRRRRTPRTWRCRVARAWLAPATRMAVVSGQWRLVGPPCLEADPRTSTKNYGTVGSEYALPYRRLTFHFPIQLTYFFRALISLNVASARSNLLLNAHIAMKISRKLAEVFALSLCPNVKMLLLRKYPIIIGSEIR